MSRGGLISNTDDLQTITSRGGVTGKLRNSVPTAVKERCKQNLKSMHRVLYSQANSLLFENEPTVSGGTVEEVAKRENRSRCRAESPEKKP